MQSMTVTEVRDRLDKRFRLLVGSRRELERHQTLRHAVQWSYDLLNEAEKSLLQRAPYSQAVSIWPALCGVSGSDDEFNTLDTLDALVRKSLLSRTGQRASRDTPCSKRFANSPRSNSLRPGTPTLSAPHTPGTSQGSRMPITTLWDGPRQHEVYSWLKVEMANLRTAFRWALDRNDIDTASAIAIYAALAGFWSDQYEPIRWNEELIGPRTPPDTGDWPSCMHCGALLHVRSDRGSDRLCRCRAGGGHQWTFRRNPQGERGITGRPVCRGRCTRTVGRLVPHRDGATSRGHIHTRAIFALALKLAGADDEAVAVAEELPAMVDATDNPTFASWGLFAYGTAHRDRAPTHRLRSPAQRP